jgi:hypothetical protein
MKQLITIILVTFCTMALAKETFLEADAKCLATKNQLLKQARHEMIEACKKNKEFGSQTNACESYYADYGNPLFDPKGFQIKKGIFDDIPECLRAQELQLSTDRY